MRQTMIVYDRVDYHYLLSKIAKYVYTDQRVQTESASEKINKIYLCNYSSYKYLASSIFLCRKYIYLIASILSLFFRLSAFFLIYLCTCSFKYSLQQKHTELTDKA